MTQLNEQIFRIFDLTKSDPKPIYGVLAHLTSEVGELAEAVEHHCGHLQKTMKEPIVGEVADVIQCALSLLAMALPGITNANRLQMLEQWMALKTNKWAGQLARPAPVKVNPLAALVKSNFVNSAATRQACTAVQEAQDVFYGRSVEQPVKRLVYIDIRKGMLPFFKALQPGGDLKTGKRKVLSLENRGYGDYTVLLRGQQPAVIKTHSQLFHNAFRKQTETGQKISLAVAHTYLKI